MVKITSCLVFQFVVAEWAAEMDKFTKFASGSFWEPLYVLIPKLEASGSLWEPLYVLIPKLGAPREVIKTLCTEPSSTAVRQAKGNIRKNLPWKPLGASGSRFMY
jgi:hypothetical protein